MAETVSTLYAVLGRRVRDPNHTAHLLTDVILLLSHLQRLVNAATGAVQSEVVLPFNDAVPTTIFDISLVGAAPWRVERLQFQGRDVLPCDWQTFGNIDPFWIRAMRPRPKMWSMIGRRLLAVTPSAGPSATITVRGPKVLTALTTLGQATELPDTAMPALLAWAEQLLLMRHRLFTSVKPAVEHGRRALETAKTT